VRCARFAYSCGLALDSFPLTCPPGGLVSASFSGLAEPRVGVGQCVGAAVRVGCVVEASFGTVAEALESVVETVGSIASFLLTLLFGLLTSCAFTLGLCPRAVGFLAVASALLPEFLQPLASLFALLLGLSGSFEQLALFPGCELSGQQPLPFPDRFGSVLA